MGPAGCWSAGAGAINNNRCCVYPPQYYCRCLLVLGLLDLSLSLFLLRTVSASFTAMGPKEARLSFTTATVSTAVAHTVATVPPGLLSWQVQASFDGSRPVWDDGRTGASTGGLEVACCGPAAGWGRRFWARDQGDQRWGVLVRDASGREALSGPLALAVPAPDGPSFRARRGRRDR